MLKQLCAPAIFAFGLVGSAAHADEKFTIQADRVAAKVGAASTAHVSVKPNAGFHINDKFPTSLKVLSSDGVTVPKLALGKEDVKLSEHEAAFEVVFTPSAAGKKSIDGELRFAVCSADSCDPHREKFSIPVDAK